MPAMTPVNSSNIAAIGWEEHEVPEDANDPHERRGTLTVDFRSGRTYRYMDVPESVYDDLLNAPSVGQTFATLVRQGGYVFEKVEG